MKHTLSALAVLLFACTLSAQTFTTSAALNTTDVATFSASLSSATTAGTTTTTYSPIRRNCTCSNHVLNQLLDSAGNSIDGGWYGSTCTTVTLNPVLQVQLLEDTDYQWGTGAYQEEDCFGYPPSIRTIMTNIFSHRRIAHTRTVIASATVTNCSGLSGTLCDYSVKAFCTLATTPPTYNPTQIRDAWPLSVTPDGWEAHSLCKRDDSTGTWSCGSNLTSYATRLYGVFNQEACSVFH